MSLRDGSSPPVERALERFPDLSCLDIGHCARKWPDDLLNKTLHDTS